VQSYIRDISVTAILLIVGLFSVSANAQTFLPSEVCDNCTTQQMSQKARLFGQTLPIGVVTKYYVFNPTGDIAKKYEVLRDFDGGDIAMCSQPGSSGNIQCQVRVYVTTLEIEGAIAAMNEALRLTAQVGDVVIPNSPGMPATPFDDIQLVNNQFGVSQAIENQLLSSRIAAIVYSARVFGKLQSEATIKVKYSDGGRAQYEWNNITGKWQPVQGSYVDQAGNIIPQTRETIVPGNNPNVTIEYHFNTSTTANMERFAQQIAGLGVPVTGVPSATNRTIICWTEWATNSVTLHCKYAG